jgi:hypothetical protein
MPIVTFRQSIANAFAPLLISQRRTTLSVRARESGHPVLPFIHLKFWVPAFAGTNGWMHPFNTLLR